MYYIFVTSSTTEKIEKAVKKAGGKFKKRTNYANYEFTRTDYETGMLLLENEFNLSDFFEIFGAEVDDYTNGTKENLYDFLDHVDEIVKDLEFNKKHSYVGFTLEQISFRKYLKVVYDNRIDLLRKPIDINSSFDSNEYVIYDERRSRLRYIVLVTNH